MKNYKPIPLEKGNYYHIYNRGNNSIDVFFDAESYYHFLRLYDKYISPIADTYAWCLLKNHFHILVYLRLDNEIEFEKLEYSTIENLKEIEPSKQFGFLFNAYTQAINKKFNRTGGLFEKPFERKLITSDTYLKNIIHYIHNNPVQHGFIKQMSLYPWSSYDSIISDKPTKLKRKEVLAIYGGKDEFEEYHKNNLNINEITNFIIE
ncbi:Transposase IS200-like [Flavobacteriaceae bacterium]